MDDLINEQEGMFWELKLARFLLTKDLDRELLFLGLIWIETIDDLLNSNPEILRFTQFLSTNNSRALCT